MDISGEELNGLLSQYGGLSEAHFFYNKTIQLRFERKHWSWYLVKEDGTFERQYGVTGVVHIVDHSEPLMAWAKKRAMEKLRRLMIARAGGGSEDAQMRLFIGELDQIIREAKQADEEELNAAADTGHAAHDWIEQLVKATIRGDEARRNELLAKLPADQRAANCCMAALEWMVQHNVRWISTERRVYSKQYKYAGTMDGLARIDSCNDPLCCKHEFKDRLSVVDWKTSGNLYIEFLYQVAAYRQALEEETGQQVEDTWIIRLGKDDAEFDPWFVEGRELYERDWNGYLACLRLYQMVEETEGRVADIKGMRKAVQLEVDRKKKEAAHRIRCPKADEYKGVRISRCLPDGTQCQTCREKYELMHQEKNNECTD